MRNDQSMKTSPPLLAHVVFRFGVGGLENGIVNLINHLPGERWRHAIVSLTEVSPEFTERITRSDVHYIALGKRPGHLVRDYPQLLRVFKALRPVIVHTRNLAALEAVVPAQIYNGVDTARFYPATGARASITGCPFQAPDQWLIGSVGRLEGIKDPLNLVRAFVLALKMQPAAANHLRLVVVGDGALRLEADAVLAEAGLRELAWFAGERADVPQFLRGLDCFVLPSLAEGVSNTILEAMATRLPVIATHVGGNAELIEPGMTGTLVPSARADALARAMLAYFGDRATARRHAKAAHHVALTRFSLATMVAAYARVYERSLAAAGIALPPSGEGLDAPLRSPKTTPLQSVSHS